MTSGFGNVERRPPMCGDVVILAVPYAAAVAVVSAHGPALAGKDKILN